MKKAVKKVSKKDKEAAKAEKERVAKKLADKALVSAALGTLEKSGNAIKLSNDYVHMSKIASIQAGMTGDVLSVTADSGAEYHILAELAGNVVQRINNYWQQG